MIIKGEELLKYYPLQPLQNYRRRIENIVEMLSTAENRDFIENQLPEQEIPDHDLQITDPSLEDAFIALMQADDTSGDNQQKES